MSIRHATLLTIALIGLLSGCAAHTPTPPSDPGAITAAGTLATPLLLVGEERTVYAVVRIGTRSLAERPPGPVNVALCIDTSGSMEGAPIERARRAAIDLVASLKDGDRLAVVSFNTQYDVVLPSNVLDEEVRAEAIAAIGSLPAIGTTELAGGLETAVGEVARHFDEGGINRVILLGDGVPNQADRIETVAANAGARGISVTALGLGLDYDEVLMGKIAEASGGRFRYVDDADKLAAFFEEELLRLHTAYARNATIRITAGPGVRLEAVVGAPSPPAGGSIQFPLGDIARGETREVVVRMTATARKADAPVELLDVVVGFDDAVGAGGHLERRIYFGAYGSDDAEKVAEAYDPEVELAAALAEAGATTITALELAKQQQYARAREMLESAAEAARAQTRRTPSAELERHASDMIAVANDMPEADPAPADHDFAGEDIAATPVTSPIEPLPEPAARRRKEVHDRAYQMSH